MKRLAVYHDHCSRDNAICYVDGQVYEGRDHYEILECNFEETDDMDMDDFERQHDVAFAHKVNKEKAIYLETNSMSGNAYPEEVARALKGVYPEYTIYNDDDQNAAKIAKVITADAYKWVFDRAEHIRENNPDMDEEESYGIAWKQYKKDNPKWKSKKQKEKDKKKKKVSRLRLADALDSREDDNSDLYYTIESYISDIENSLDLMLDVDNCFTQVDVIYDGISNISSNAQLIHDSANSAKDNGIHNEDQLHIGKDQIQELERELKELESDLKDIVSENDSLESEIQDIELAIDNIREELNRLLQEVVADAARGMVHEERTHTFICYAHDAIMETATELMSFCSTIESQINDIVSEADGSNDEDISDKINDCVNDLESDTRHYIRSIEGDMREAKDMNSNMGKGISNKNEQIESLSEQISEKEDEISEAQDNQGDLQSKLGELKTLLNQLESELANI